MGNRIVEADYQPGKPIIGLAGFGEKAKQNFDELFSALGTIQSDQVPNGSFEIDTDGDGRPDSWTVNLYPGGSSTLDGNNAAHGSKCITFVHPGGVNNGGGSADSEYIQCAELQRRILGAIMWATASGMKNIIRALYYDKSKVYLSSADLYTGTASPTTPTLFILGFTPPATARFFKIELVGGYTDTNVAGTAYFDGLWIDKMPQWNFVQDFTIGSQSWNGAWSDRASTTITMPYAWGLPIYMAFTAQLRTDNGGTFTQQRFRIGAAYSNASAQITSLTDVTTNYAIVYTPDVAGSATPKVVTIYMQLASNGAGTQAIGQKLAETTGVVLHNIN